MAEWEPIATAPFNVDLELSACPLERRDPLVILCRRTERGWVLPATGDTVPINPTHWRHIEPLFANLDRRAVTIT